MTWPSFLRTPILSFLGGVTAVQGIGRHLGSMSQGEDSITDFAKSVRSGRVRAIGPRMLVAGIARKKRRIYR